MDWQLAVFETIDMRSFSNLWYWIGLAVAWSSASHWIMGVPYDMVPRARRLGGEDLRDLEDVVRVMARRLLFIADTGGTWLVALASFVLTALLVLGLYYWVEFAQALFLILFPMTLVTAMNISAARRISAGYAASDELFGILVRLRIKIQLLGMVSIFVTAMWGMYQNLAHLVRLTI